VGDRIVKSGIPICLIATLQRLLNFLVELFGDEASEEAGGTSDLSRNQKRNWNVFTGKTQRLITVSRNEKKPGHFNCVEAGRSVSFPFYFYLCGDKRERWNLTLELAGFFRELINARKVCFTKRLYLTSMFPRIVTWLVRNWENRKDSPPIAFCRYNVLGTWESVGRNIINWIYN